MDILRLLKEFKLRKILLLQNLFVFQIPLVLTKKSPKSLKRMQALKNNSLIVISIRAKPIWTVSLKEGLNLNMELKLLILLI
jgi:hypothetical protein